MNVKDQDLQDLRVPVVCLAVLAIMVDQVTKVIQGSQDFKVHLEVVVPLVNQDFQALQDQRETHIPTTLLG